MLDDEEQLDFLGFAFSESKQRIEAYLEGRSRLSQTMLYTLRILTQLAAILIFVVIVLALFSSPLLLAIRVSMWFLLVYLVYLLIYSFAMTKN